MDEFIYKELSRPNFDQKIVTAVLEEQLSEWSEVRKALIGIIGSQHELIESFDSILFERQSQIVLLGSEIKYW